MYSHLMMSPVCSDWSAPLAITSSLGNKDCVMRLHHRVTEEKAGIPMRRFRQLRNSFLCERVTASGVFFGLLYRETITCKLYNTLKESGKPEKHNRSALNPT